MPSSEKSVLISNDPASASKVCATTRPQYDPKTMPEGRSPVGVSLRDSGDGPYPHRPIVQARRRTLRHDASARYHGIPSEGGRSTAR